MDGYNGILISKMLHVTSKHVNKSLTGVQNT